ncbi:MAG: hypothetical protein MRK02_04145 [Candidatus Scalindua sp.]|nr:hypothetical protein [Candidatus Scalindua sp.]
MNRTNEANDIRDRRKGFHSARGIVKGLFWGAVVIFCLIISSAPSGAQWKQSKFVIGTAIDPPITETHDESKDLAAMLQARAAYFNLLSGFGIYLAPDFSEHSYRLGIADKAGLKSLVRDGRFIPSENKCNPQFHFDQSVANNLTTDYLGLDLRRRRAIFGYNIVDEPCLWPYYFAFDVTLTSVKQWITHLKRNDPAKLPYLNFPGFIEGNYNHHEDLNLNCRFDFTGYDINDDGINDRREFDLDHDGHIDVFEDVNANGILDPGEDIDGDGKLDLVSREYHELYLDAYLKDSDARRLSNVVAFDHYPFLQYAPKDVEQFYKEVEPGTFVDTFYFYNLSVVKQKAGTRPFWAHPQSLYHQVSWFFGGYALTVDPDPDHLRFMVFAPVAYGAKGLMYYSYGPLLDPPNNFTALVDFDNAPTQKYSYVQRINHYIRDIVGPVVMNSVHLGAFHKSKKPTGEAIPDDQKITESTPLVADVSDDNILIGLFRDATNYYVLVVNKSLYLTASTVVLTLKGGWRNKIQLAPSVVSYREGDTYFSCPTSYDATTNTTLVAIPPLAGGEGRLLKIAATNIFADLIGDKDSFHSGDVADVTRKSPWLIANLGTIGGIPGYLPEVDLDVFSSNRPVGLTHVLPTNGIIATATLRFQLRSNDLLVYNDTILFDDSVSEGPGQPYLPYIALSDLLGREPQAGETEFYEVDLSRVPIRTRDTSGGPDEYRNFLPLLADGEFNLIFLDDVAVDYSELRVIYADAQSLVSFEALRPTSPPSTTDTTDCPVEFAGKYFFDALLTNRSGLTLSDIRIGIDELSNENLLLSTDKERLEASEWFDVPATGGYADGTLKQGESVIVPFTVCMKVWQPFRLFVNVAGTAH